MIKPGDGVLFDIGRPEEKEPGGRVWRVQQIKPAWPARRGRSSHSGNCLQSGRRSTYLESPSAATSTGPTTRHSASGSNRAMPRTGRRARVARGAADRRSRRRTHARPHRRREPDRRATWPGPLELARKQPTTSDEHREQLSRLGDTPFELGELRVDLPAGVMVPRSVLNDLRRQAAGELAERRSEVEATRGRGTGGAGTNEVRTCEPCHFWHG